MWNSNHTRVAALRMWRDSGGQDLIEYSLGAGMVALAAVAAMPILGAAVNNIFVRVGSFLSSSVY
jgi:pilus assembly protein Flp/PilA